MHTVSIKNQLLAEIHQINNPMLLVQLFDMLQIVRSHADGVAATGSPVLQFAGCLSDADTAEIQQIISAEFNQPEGDW